MQDNIKEMPISDLIGQRYGDYAKYIIQERAIPDARDGLKPVQRRILFGMNKDGNTFDKPYRKCAKTVGMVMGNYHPHGDSSVYEAMVNLSQPWRLNLPLVQMHGNNGSSDGDSYAASRYVEGRLAEVSHELLDDLDKDTVDWTPNFDDTEYEPTVLPAKFPNLLINGTMGIAAGYATNIPPHNLKEVVNATIFRIKKPKSSLEEIMQIIKGPDFPTAGIICGTKGIKDAFSTGLGKVVMRSRANIEREKNGLQHIVITEVPYGVYRSDIVKRIDDIRFNKTISGILEVRDESGRDGIRMVIDVHKDADAEMILNYLYKNTPLQSNFNYNMVAIVDKRPKLMTLLDCLDAYIAFGKEVILKRSQSDYKQCQQRSHILEGLVKAMSILDKVIKTIKESTDKADAISNLVKKFGFSEQQADAIVMMRLYRLTNTDIVAVQAELEELVRRMKDLEEIINNPKRLIKQFCTELEDVIKKYGKDRLTQIEGEAQEVTFDKTSLVAKEDVFVTVSKDGYVKRVSVKSYTSSKDEETGIKEDDVIIYAGQATTHDSLLMFNAAGEYVQLPIAKMAESKWKDCGLHVSNYCKTNSSGGFVYALLVTDFAEDKVILITTKKGQVKKTKLNYFELQKVGRSSKAINLKDDEVIAVTEANDKDYYFIVTHDGFGLLYTVNEIPVQETSGGVRAIKLSSDDTVAGACIVPEQGGTVEIITNKKTEKRQLDKSQIAKRAQKGSLVIKHTKTNPTYIVGLN